MAEVAEAEMVTFTAQDPSNFSMAMALDEGTGFYFPWVEDEVNIDSTDAENADAISSIVSDVNNENLVQASNADNEGDHVQSIIEAAPAPAKNVEPESNAICSHDGAEVSEEPDTNRITSMNEADVEEASKPRDEVKANDAVDVEVDKAPTKTVFDESEQEITVVLEIPTKNISNGGSLMRAVKYDGATLAKCQSQSQQIKITTSSAVNSPIVESPKILSVRKSGSQIVSMMGPPRVIEVIDLDDDDEDMTPATHSQPKRSKSNTSATLPLPSQNSYKKRQNYVVEIIPIPIIPKQPQLILVTQEIEAGAEAQPKLSRGRGRPRKTLQNLNKQITSPTNKLAMIPIVRLVNCSIPGLPGAARIDRTASSLTPDAMVQLVMPSQDWSINTYPKALDKIFTISETVLTSNCTEIIQKSITITSDWRITFTALSSEVPKFAKLFQITKVSTIVELQRVLNYFAGIEICPGVAKPDKWASKGKRHIDHKFRSFDCPLIIKPEPKPRSKLPNISANGVYTKTPCSKCTKLSKFLDSLRLI